jgi:UDP-GlcNAc:undecaprenyl-phosphate GlcNAc-1-phosphate transferase
MVIDTILLLLSVAGSRLSFRLLRNFLQKPRPTGGRRVLIYGAGDGGELLVRELMQNRELALLPVGFVDDDPQKAGRVIHGVPVLGTSDEFAGILASAAAEELVVSTPKIDAERRARIEASCRDAGLPVRRLRIALE